MAVAKWGVEKLMTCFFCDDNSQQNNYEFQKCFEHVTCYVTSLGNHVMRYVFTHVFFLLAPAGIEQWFQNISPQKELTEISIRLGCFGSISWKPLCLKGTWQGIQHVYTIYRKLFAELNTRQFYPISKPAGQSLSCAGSQKCLLFVFCVVEEPVKY